jgi:hypothetical protein
LPKLYGDTFLKEIENGLCVGYARRRRFHSAGASVCGTERQGITVADSYNEIIVHSGKVKIIVHSGKVKKGVKNVKLLI